MEQTVFDLWDGRVLIDYGPVTMVLLAEVRGKPQPSLCRAFFPQLQKLLTALHNDLPQLRRPPAEIDGHSLSAPGQTMLAAVRAADDPTLTPMAAVVGTIADAAADWLWQAHPDRVIVNNGGDIAIRLAPGQQTSVGVVTSLRTQQIDRIVTVKAADGIGGSAPAVLADAVLPAALRMPSPYSRPPQHRLMHWRPILPTPHLSLRRASKPLWLAI